MKHTLGPWKYGQSAKTSEGAYDWGVKAMVDGNFEVIAEAFGRSSEDMFPPAEANARLIAAAPDLLEACIEFCRKVDVGQARSTHSYKQMAEAIDKATDQRKEK